MSYRKLEIVEMRDFQNTFETRKRSFISAFSICITVPLMDVYGSIKEINTR